MRVFLINLEKMNINPKGSEVRVIPRPQVLEVGTDGYLITDKSSVLFKETQQEEFLKELLNEELTHYNLPIVNESRQESPVPKSERIYKNKLHEDQGYFLEITDNKVEIEARTETGIFYGVQTLIQLFDQLEDGTVYLPSVSIIDYPDLEIRGISDDTGRGQTPTVENMLKHIRILAKYKMNVIFYGYGSDCWELKKHPKLTESRDVFTPNEVATFEREAKKHHMELVPIFQSLGHMDNITVFPEYRALAEFPGSSCLDITNPDAKKFVGDLHEEILTMSSSTWAHMGCDEIWDFGTYATRSYLEQKGESEVLLEYYKWIYGNVRKYGKEKIFLYHDNVYKDKVLQEGLPKDLIVFFWEYFTKWTYGKRGSIIGLNMLKKCRKAGFDVVVSPSTLSWTRSFPDFKKSNKNIISLTKRGVKDGAIGMVNSHWGDFGNEHFRENNLYGYILSADVSWNSLGFSIDNFHQAFAWQFFGTKDLRIIESMHLFGSINQRLQSFLPIALPQFYNKFWKHPFPAPKFKVPTKKLKRIMRDMNRGLTLLEDIKNKITKNRDYLDYIQFGGELGHYFAFRRLKTYDIQQKLMNRKRENVRNECISQLEELMLILKELKDKYQQLWLRCAKPAALQRLLPKFDLYERFYKEKIEQIKKEISWENPFLESEWISYPEKKTQQQPRYLRNQFTIPEGEIESALLQGIAHHFMTVYVNGTRVGDVQSRQSLDFRPYDVAVQVFDIKDHLKIGENVIAVDARNYLFGEAAINIYCEIKLGDGEIIKITTDPSWRASKSEENNWNQVNFDESFWIPVKSMGAPPRYNGQIMKPYLEEGFPSKISIAFGTRIIAAALIPSFLSFLIDPVLKRLGFL